MSTSALPRAAMVKATVLAACAAVLAVCALVLATPGALADTTASSNWAGYAVHHQKVTFRAASAQWRVPHPSCLPGHAAYSAMWVGLGGYNRGSQALEQIGTELDCTAAGKAAASAWYELVPAPSHSIRLTVAPGDLIHASVAIAGKTVTLKLSVGRGRPFTRTVRVSVLDASSAEWILEAPSDCQSANRCRTLSLADFATATFSDCSAQSLNRHRGAISDPRWTATRIQLIAGGRGFGVIGPSRGIGVAATSALSDRGSAFTVTYRTIQAPGSALSPAPSETVVAYPRR